MAGCRKIVFPLSVAGANTIFIYALSEVLRGWLDKSVAVFTGDFWFLGTFGPGGAELRRFAVMWYLCYWLYRRKSS